MAKKLPAGWTPETTSTRMKRLRIERGVTRKQMADWLRIDPKEIAALEADRRAWEPSLIDRWISGCTALRR